MTATVPASIVTVDAAPGVRIHGIQTGWLAVKTAHGRVWGPEAVRGWTSDPDAVWSDWIPTLCFAVEHAEGVFVVDAGQSAAMTEREYFDTAGPKGQFYRRNLRFRVAPEEEIGAQFQALGLKPSALVLTHLRGDHTGGLDAFANVPVFAPREDYPEGQGVLASKLPAWFAPRFAEFDEVRGGLAATPLTRNGDVSIVATPGHTRGHQSLLLETPERNYLFAGDATFDERQLLSGEAAGIHEAPDAAAATREQLLALCAARPTVYLPAHDPASLERLAAGRATTHMLH